MTMPRKRDPTRRALIRFIRDSFLPELRGVGRQFRQGQTIKN